MLSRDNHSTGFDLELENWSIVLKRETYILNALTRLYEFVLLSHGRVIHVLAEQVAQAL